MTNSIRPRPAIFIDRDGTLIEEVDFLSSIDHLRLFDYTFEALEMLKDRGYLLIVVTNQSGIGRGLFDESAINTIHDALSEALPDKIDAFYFCPHLRDGDCDCRKPAVGMIKQALEDFHIDIANSWMIGDKKIDIETGFNAGTSTALVLTGYGEEHLSYFDRMPDIVADNLLEAARDICLRND